MNASVHQKERDANGIDYEPMIESVYLVARYAKDKATRDAALRRMTALIEERNGRRTPEQVAELEKARGLR